jgi:uncharacterized Tic20 family protein
MSQQQMPYHEGSQRGSESTYKGYEELPPSDYAPSASWEMGGQKISLPSMGREATAGQRLVLAIASIVAWIVVLFGLIGVVIGTNAQNWVVIPVAFMMILLTVLLGIINQAFNRVR